MGEISTWARGPFELIIHAEGHLRDGHDFDRRIALIGFDNAIEVAISTYLSIPPQFRDGRSYKKSDVERWERDYHSKLDFLGTTLEERGVGWNVKEPDIIWVHRQRNQLYHSSYGGVPEMSVIEIARNAALWIFSVLFDVEDADAELDKSIRSREARDGRESSVTHYSPSSAAATKPADPAAKGWQPLSTLESASGSRPPCEVQFPDNSRHTITYWKDVVIEVVRWLLENDHLYPSLCPIKRKGRHLVATSPFHASGTSFESPYQMDSLYIETHGVVSLKLRNINTIIEHVRQDPTQFKVRFD